MTAKEAKKLFEKDLEHTRQHLQDKDEYKEQHPEFYEELKRWEEAEKLAIKTLTTQTEEEKRTRERITRLEEAILLMARGAQMTLKKYSGAGLEDWEFEDLIKIINEIQYITAQGNMCLIRLN